MGKGYHGQFTNPKVDEYIHNRFFSHNPLNLTCMEAGAEEGRVTATCLFFEENLNWTCINVEPNPYLFYQLIKNRTISINLNYALVSQELSNKELQFQAYKVGLGYVINEVSEEHKAFTEKYAGNIHKKTGIVNVSGISYNDLAQKLSIKEINLLVLDTEGNEFNILKSLNKDSILPKVLCIEDNLSEKKKFDSILCPLGYKFDAKIHNNIHYYL